MIRLQKVMADRGVGSRRRSEELITEGRVRVDGELVTTLGTRVAGNARIEIDGRAIKPSPARRYILLHKPVGIVSTAHDEHGRRTVVDHVGAGERLYPVGRLDTDSAGLLLLTNDGAWAERVLHPRYGHEREYDVTAEGDLTDDALAQLRRGIPLEEGLARAVRVTIRSRSRERSRLSITLRTGWKRQVRRMCSAVGLQVTRLVRVRMGPLELGRLRSGEFRDLTRKEVDALVEPPKEQVASVRGRTEAPRVTPRAGSSRARVEGPRRQRFGERKTQAGRPTRERGPRAAAGPAALRSARRASARRVTAVDRRA